MTASRTPTAYVLDDDRSFCLILSSALKRFGFACEVFNSSTEFEKRVQENLPSLCILDLNVEGTNSSLDLIKTIRSKYSPILPIIVVSSDSRSSAITEALESGGTDYLTKPLMRDILIPKLKRYTSSKELQDAFDNMSVRRDEVELKVTMELDMNLLEIDEFGVRISSPTLVCKGSLLFVSGRTLKDITERADPLLVTVISSELNAKSNLYEMYLEFDLTDQKLLNQVRTWLTHQEAMAA